MCWENSNYHDQQRGTQQSEEFIIIFCDMLLVWFGVSLFAHPVVLGIGNVVSVIEALKGQMLLNSLRVSTCYAYCNYIGMLQNVQNWVEPMSDYFARQGQL